MAIRGATYLMLLEKRVPACLLQDFLVSFSQPAAMCLDESFASQVCHCSKPPAKANVQLLQPACCSLWQLTQLLEQCTVTINQAQTHPKLHIQHQPILLQSIVKLKLAHVCVDDPLQHLTDKDLHDTFMSCLIGGRAAMKALNMVA